VFLAAAAAVALAGCASMPQRDPLQVTVAGIEGLPGEGMEIRMLVKLRVQNPNDTVIDFSGAYLEFDVTLAREKVRSAKEHGARITFTAWLLKTIGDAIGRHKEVAAFRLGRRRLMVFDDAHISIIVEREIGGRKVPLPMVLREANRKTVEEIAAEKAGQIQLGD